MQRAACQSGAHRIEQSGFDENIGGVFITRCAGPTHDARQAEDFAGIVADGGHSRVKFVGLAVQRVERLATFCGGAPTDCP